jgi:hypothetical protein
MWINNCFSGTARRDVFLRVTGNPYRQVSVIIVPGFKE